MTAPKGQGMKGKRKPKGSGKPNLPPEDRPLTKKMKALADAYLAPGTTGAAAAIASGYPKGNASVHASYVLKLPHVVKYLTARRAEIQAKHDITLDMVIREFAKVAFSNMDDYIQDDGTGRPQFRLVGQIGRDKLAVVTEMTIDTRKEFEGRGEDREHVADVERIRFKLASKVDALDKLAKHLGMYPSSSVGGGGDDDLEGGKPRKVTIEVTGGMSRPDPDGE